MSTSIAAHVLALGQGDKLAAARALADLAREPANQDAIREAGGVDPLVALVREGTPEQQKWAAWALGNLANGNAANQDAIRAAGGVHALVWLVRKGVPIQQEWAAPALLSLAFGSAANQDAIRAAGGLSSVFAQVEKMTVEELKKALERLGLQKSGVKAVLIERLHATIKTPVVPKVAAAPGVPLPSLNAQQMPAAQ